LPRSMLHCISIIMGIFRNNLLGKRVAA